MIAKRMRLFAGTAHPEFARVGRAPEAYAGPSEAFHFTDGNLFVEDRSPCAGGYEVFLVQTLSPPVNDHLMELVFLIDACKRASSGAGHGGHSLLLMRLRTRR